MSKKLSYQIVLVVFAVVCGCGAVYAAFVSNTVTIANNTLTTGEAAIKICDYTGSNSWTTSLSPSLNLDNVAPGEERELFPDRDIEVGNDGGYLDQALTNNRCPSYALTPNRTQTVLAIVPIVNLLSPDCPSTLATDISLRFDFNGTSSSAKTLLDWSTNHQLIGDALRPNTASQLKVFAALAPDSSSQNASCTFTINLTGQQ